MLQRRPARQNGKVFFGLSNKKVIGNRKIQSKWLGIELVRERLQSRESEILLVKGWKDTNRKNNSNCDSNSIERGLRKFALLT